LFHQVSILKYSKHSVQTNLDQILESLPNFLILKVQTNILEFQIYFESIHLSCQIFGNKFAILFQYLVQPTKQPILFFLFISAPAFSRAGLFGPLGPLGHPSSSLSQGSCHRRRPTSHRTAHPLAMPSALDQGPPPTPV
jgi:hypothetical protein